MGAFELHGIRLRALIEGLTSQKFMTSLKKALLAIPALAAALKPGGTLAHTSRTFHFQGPESELDRIARKTLGVGIHDIRGAFGGP